MVGVIMRCGCCGKFRKIYELVTMASDYEQWDECFYCMSEFDFEQYSKILIEFKMQKELDKIIGVRKQNDHTTKSP